MKEIIGEATAHLSDETRREITALPFRKMRRPFAQPCLRQIVRSNPAGPTIEAGAINLRIQRSRRGRSVCFGFPAKKLSAGRCGGISRLGRA